ASDPESWSPVTFRGYRRLGGNGPAVSHISQMDRLEKAVAQRFPCPRPPHDVHKSTRTREPIRYHAHPSHAGRPTNRLLPNATFRHHANTEAPGARAPASHARPIGLLAGFNRSTGNP